MLITTSFMIFTEIIGPYYFEILYFIHAQIFSIRSKSEELRGADDISFQALV